MKKQVKKLRPRNWLAVLAHRRKAGVLKDRRQERGGSRDRQREWLEEAQAAGRR